MFGMVPVFGAMRITGVRLQHLFNPPPCGPSWNIQASQPRTRTTKEMTIRVMHRHLDHPKGAHDIS
jgi:hypothetical protein